MLFNKLKGSTVRQEWVPLAEISPDRVTVTGRGEVIGSLNIVDRDPGELSPSALAAAQVLAEDLGIACENTAKWLHESRRDDPDPGLRPRRPHQLCGDRAADARRPLLRRLEPAARRGRCRAGAVPRALRPVPLERPLDLGPVDETSTIPLILGRRRIAGSLTKMGAWKRRPQASGVTSR